MKHIAVIFLTTSIAVLLSCNNQSEQPAVTIESFNPTLGIEGTSVTIKGSNFAVSASENFVTFNGVAAIVKQASPGLIIAEVPADASSGKIEIITRGIKTRSIDNFKVIRVSTISGYGGDPLLLTCNDLFNSNTDTEFYFDYLGVARNGLVLGYTKDSVLVTFPNMSSGGFEAHLKLDNNILHLGTLICEGPCPAAKMTPNTGTKNTLVTITSSKVSSQPGVTKISLVPLRQRIVKLKELECGVTSVVSNPIDSQSFDIKFTVPDGVIIGTSYAIKITVGPFSFYSDNLFTGQ